MRPAVRLGIFALVLPVVFGGALVIGRSVDPEDRGVPSAHPGDDHGATSRPSAHPAEDHTATAEPQGLESVAGGLALTVELSGGTAGEPATLRLRILRTPGDAVTEFDVEQERRMHVIAVRRDLTGFQHLHPEMTADGTWVTPMTLPSAGTWRVFADFSTGGTRRTLGTDIHAAGVFQPEALPAPTAIDVIDDYEVSIAGDEDLVFTISRNAERVAPDPYLGAAGHLVVLRAGDLAYLHAHPSGVEREPRFRLTFPSAGRYRIFFQFSHGGSVHTAAFTSEVHR